MKGLPGTTTHTTVSPCILVVDDDRRVVDLLNIALAAHGYRVVSAVDGEEAVRLALGKRPDLVVLDVRLPKKSGLEVCEILRQDPDDPYLPIIMVSAASEMDARLQGFARGADDYLAKPFSPKELVARIKRLLARANDAREARRRGREAELELMRTRDNVKRAHAELQRERRLREFTTGIARDLHGALDAEELAGRFLLSVQTQLEVSVAALLATERAGGPLVPVAIRGDGFERVAGISLAADGELVTLLMGLGRPVRLSELERFPELSAELPLLSTQGISLVAPLRGANGIEGVLLADDRLDGDDASRMDLDVLNLLCDAAAVGLANARRCRSLADGLVETLVAHAGEVARVDDSEMRVEAVGLVERAARGLLIPPRLRGLIGHGVALGEWALTAAGRHAIALAATADPTGRLLELGRLLDCGGPEGEDCEGPHMTEATMMLRVARDYVAERRQGATAVASLARAMDAAGADLPPHVRQALATAMRSRRPARPAPQPPSPIGP
jgi:DNA-binding response OmpR family regulator